MPIVIVTHTSFRAARLCVGPLVVQITGMGFSSVSGGVTVRFACPKGFVEAEGQVVSDTEVSFLTPNFEKFGPMQVRPLYKDIIWLCKPHGTGFSVTVEGSCV